MGARIQFRIFEIKAHQVFTLVGGKAADQGYSGGQGVSFDGGALKLGHRKNPHRQDEDGNQDFDQSQAPFIVDCGAE